MTILPIKSLEIENFRGVRHLKLELHHKVTVLFGANATGKTSVLDALCIGLGPVSSRYSPGGKGRSFEKHGDIRIPYKDRPKFNERAAVECPYVRISVATETGIEWQVVKSRSALDRSRTPQASLKSLHNVVDPLVREALNAQRDATTSPLPLPAMYGTERSVVEIPLREKGFRTEPERFEASDLSRSASTKFKTVFEWFRVMEDQERRERENRRDFDYKLPELEWVRQAVNKSNLRCMNPRIETKPIRMIVDFLHNDGETEPLDIRSLSDGFRTHLSLVVDIARRMVQLNFSPDTRDPNRGTASPAIILIDEIDLHLDPLWQSQVVHGLLNAFPNAQFVITTHSEQVLGSVDAASVRKLLWVDGEISVESVPFAQGATGERILIDLMGAPERPDGPVTRKLRHYLHMVDNGEGYSEEARAMRAELESLLPNEPALRHARLEMQRRNLMEKLKAAEE